MKRAVLDQDSVGVFPLRLGTATALLLFVVVGCGTREETSNSDGDGASSFSTAACPCTSPNDGRFTPSFEMVGGMYWIDNEVSPAEIAVLSSGVETRIPSTLDCILCKYVGETPASTPKDVLILAGCAGTVPRVVVFMDVDDDGVVDDVVGSLDLPVGARPHDITADLSSGEFYIRCDGTHTVLRSTDTNSDYLPDTGPTEFVPTSATVDDKYGFIRLNEGDVLLELPEERGLGSTLVRLKDTTGDGVADIVQTRTSTEYSPITPRLRRAPRSTDVTFEMVGSANASVELWEVDTDGDQLGSAALGSATLDGTGRGTITLGSARTAGTYVRLFDVTNSVSQPFRSEVEGDYPVSDDISPKTVVPSVGASIVVTGTGFSSGHTITAALMERTGEEAVIVTVTIDNDSQLTLTVPTFDPIEDEANKPIWKLLLFVDGSPKPMTEFIVTLSD